MRKIICLCVFLSLSGGGCSFSRHRLAAARVQVVKQDDKLAEEARGLTTAVVDTLSLAPTNEFMNLALTLAKADQLILGLPVSRIDVEAVLRGE